MIGNSSAWWFWCAAVLISSEKDSTEIPRIYGTSSWQDLVDEVQGTTDFTGQNHIYVERSSNQINLFALVLLVMHHKQAQAKQHLMMVDLQLYLHQVIRHQILDFNYPIIV